MWRILKKHSYKPYKLHISHTLLPGDEERRLDWCRWLSNKINDDDNFLNIIWTDESKFTNCGIFNRNTEHVWCTENPHVNRPVRNQIRFGVNVWAGIIGDCVFGPFIYEENLTGVNYLDFLRTTFANYLDEINLRRLQQLWFQHDGAPPHNTRAVCEFLNQEFPNRWIGNSGVVRWPARSPDLSPLDFLWGTLKNKVYNTPIADMNHLRNKIINSFATLRRRDVQRAVNNVRRRIHLCTRENGSYFENFL